MAIRALNSVVVANYDCYADGTNTFLAGAPLMLDSTNKVVAADRSNSAFNTLVQQMGRFVGFASDDRARTGATMILNDPVGASYTDANGVMVANVNGWYKVSKRAIGDFIDEPVTTVTNPTAGATGYEGPRRGVGVYNTPGGQFISDQYVAVATNGVNADAGSAITFAAGDLLTPGAGANKGKLVKITAANFGTDGIVVGRVDAFDAAAGLLYFTQLSTR